MLDTLVVTLLLTIPSTSSAQVWIPPESRDTPGDSIGYTCDPGATTHDVDSLRFYGIPTSGGGWRRIFSKGVRNREGQSDSTTLRLPGWLGGHFYVTAVDTARNESCASPVVYKGTVTGIADPFGIAGILTNEWYDVRGRRVVAPRGTGVYFLRWRLNGQLVGRAIKVPVLEGRPLVRVRPP